MRVLLAVDGSACSEAAVETVVDRFRAESTHVKVLHAVEWMREMPLCSSTRTVPRLEKMSSSAATPASSARAKWSSVSTPDADPRHAIVETARDWPADVIVIGSHGRRGFDRLLLGSVAESVVRHAPCSVDLVRVPLAGTEREALQSRDVAHS